MVAFVRLMCVCVCIDTVSRTFRIYSKILIGSSVLKLDLLLRQFAREASGENHPNIIRSSRYSSARMSYFFFFTPTVLKGREIADRVDKTSLGGASPTWRRRVAFVRLMQRADGDVLFILVLARGLSLKFHITS